MSANISIQNGRAEMFSGNNVVPWHKQGTVVSGLLSAHEAIIAANLGWEVKGFPVSVNGKELKFPNGETSDSWQGICRTDSGDCLGIMRGRYETIQNAECFDFMDGLVSDGHLKYETAGALRGGRQVWMMAKYDGEIKINSDAHEQWLLCVSSHDGSYALSVQWVTVRVVCSNTLSIALKSAKNQSKIRHTAGWSNKADEAKRVLGLTQDYFADIQSALSGLGSQLLTQDQMDEFSKLLVPCADESKLPTRTANIREEINTLFGRGAGNKGESRWDALQAVTDYADHRMTLRGDNSTRLESALLGSGAALKQKAFELLTSDQIMAELLTKGHAPAGSIVQGQDFARLIGN